MIDTAPRETCCIGQIKEIEIPNGWFKLPAADNGFDDLVAYSPALTDKSKLAFYYRGKPLSQDSGTAFEAVLQRNKGVLLPMDLDNVRWVLDELGDPEKFQISSAETMDLNGRVILLVQGRWLRDDFYSYDLFINAGDSGTIVQQVFFIAPKDQYFQHLSQVKDALKTVQWLDRKN